MLRGVWQAFNCLSIHGTYWVIVAGASPGETKMWAAVWKRRFFALAVRITGKLLKIDGYMFVITKQSTFSGPPGGAGNFFFVRFAREHRTPHYHFCNSNTGGMHSGPNIVTTEILLLQVYKADFGYAKYYHSSTAMLLDLIWSFLILLCMTFTTHLMSSRMCQWCSAYSNVFLSISALNILSCCFLFLCCVWVKMDPWGLKQINWFIDWLIDWLIGFVGCSQPTRHVAAITMSAPTAIPGAISPQHQHHHHHRPQLQQQQQQSNWREASSRGIIPHPFVINGSPRPVPVAQVLPSPFCVTIPPVKTATSIKYFRALLFFHNRARSMACQVVQIESAKNPRVTHSSRALQTDRQTDRQTEKRSP